MATTVTDQPEMSAFDAADDGDDGRWRRYPRVRDRSGLDRGDQAQRRLPARRDRPRPARCRGRAWPARVTPTRSP